MGAVRYMGIELSNVTDTDSIAQEKFAVKINCAFPLFQRGQTISQLDEILLEPQFSRADGVFPMAKAKVAVLRTTPATVLQDYERLFELADGPKALDPSATTILKDNISWHFPMPSANTTPWQLEGTILALQDNGFKDIVCVQNQTVVTNAYKGEDLNGYVPIFKHYNIPVKYNFEPKDMTWIEYKPKAKMNALDHIYPEGIYIPDYFVGKNMKRCCPSFPIR